MRPTCVSCGWFIKDDAANDCKYCHMPLHTDCERRHLQRHEFELASPEWGDEELL